MQEKANYKKISQINNYVKERYDTQFTDISIQKDKGSIAFLRLKLVAVLENRSGF